MSQQTAAARRPFPKVGEIFELTASEEITGLGLVEEFEGDSKGYRSSSLTIMAGMKGRFKLVVAVGYQPNIGAVVAACKAQGGLNTNGCWMKVFDDTFGNNRRNHIGVPDPSWENPYGHITFPSVMPIGERGFYRADHGFYVQSEWLWLVEVGEPTA